MTSYVDPKLQRFLRRRILWEIAVWVFNLCIASTTLLELWLFIAVEPDLLLYFLNATLIGLFIIGKFEAQDKVNAADMDLTAYTTQGEMEDNP